MLALLEVPQLTGRVNDLAGLIPADRERVLDARLAAFERETSHQIVVLTVPSLQGETIEGFSIRVVEAWKLGHEGLDNGVLFSVASGDRQARIEVGYGLEGVIPDALASRVLREQVIPHFRRGDMAAGIEAGVAALEAAARGEEIPAAQRPGRQRLPPGERIELTIFSGMFAGMVAGVLVSGRSRTLGGLLGGTGAGLAAWLLIGLLGWALASAALGFAVGAIGPQSRGRGGRLADGWGGGFGGGFGGNFGGGGGGFGGGGASGSW